MITETQYNETYKDGVRISQTPVVVDVTPREMSKDIEAKARQAIAANAAFLALAAPTAAEVRTQVQRLTRQNNALIRYVLGGGLQHGTPQTDLLTENIDT